MRVTGVVIKEEQNPNQPLTALQSESEFELTTNKISHSYPLSLNPFMKPANHPQSVKLPSMTKLLLLSFATAAQISCNNEASGWRREEAVSGE